MSSIYRFYTVYQTTNLITKQTYVGIHKTNSFKSKYTKNYYGSNKQLKQDVKALGKHNFIREWLFVFDNEQDMLNKERELVPSNVRELEEWYNEAPGGGNPPNHKGYIPHNRKLTESEVFQIIKLWNTLSYTQEQLAQTFNVTQGQITAILNRKAWINTTSHLKIRKKPKEQINKNQCILSDQQIIDMVELWNTMIYSCRELANYFNVSKNYVKNVLNRRTRKRVTRHLTIKKKSKEKIAQTISQSIQGEKHPNSKFTEEEVIEIKSDGRLWEWGGIETIARERNKSAGIISSIKHGYKWKHL